MGVSLNETGIEDRLRALGTTPVPPATQSRHLTAMASTATASRRTSGSRWATRVKIAGAAMVGFLAGSTALAAADVGGPLEPVSRVGAKAAAVVGNRAERRRRDRHARHREALRT